MSLDYNKFGPQLIKAVESNNLNKVTELLKEINANYSNGIITPLHIAVKNGNIEIAKLLIKSNANLNIKDTSGNTPLNLAIKCKNLDLVKELIKAGTDLTEANN